MHKISVRRHFCEKFEISLKKKAFDGNFCPKKKLAEKKIKNANLHRGC